MLISLGWKGNTRKRERKNRIIREENIHIPQCFFQSYNKNMWKSKQKKSNRTGETGTCELSEWSMSPLWDPSFVWAGWWFGQGQLWLSARAWAGTSGRVRWRPFASAWRVAARPAVAPAVAPTVATRARTTVTGAARTIHLHTDIGGLPLHAQTRTWEMGRCVSFSKPENGPLMVQFCPSDQLKFSLWDLPWTQSFNSNI